MRGSTAYYNVVATAAGLISIGSVNFADTYNPANKHVAIVRRR